MGSKQVLPLGVIVDQGVNAIKGYSIFPNASGLEPYHQMPFCQIQATSQGTGSYKSTEIPSAYSTAQADWNFIIYNRNITFVMVLITSFLYVLSLFMTEIVQELLKLTISTTVEM